MLLTNLFSNPLALLVYVAVLLVTIAVHEYAHARAADELGDPTPRLGGRLTLNPARHIDPVGLVLLFLIGFGWGRPVMFDPYNLANPRRDSAIISLAGPLSNFIIAILCAILLRLLHLIELPFISTIGLIVLPIAIHLNLLLGIFNLLPFAPLDGFKIVGGFLNEEHARDWYSLERYGMIFLLVFIFPLVGNRSMLEMFVSPVIQYIFRLLVG